MDKEMSAHVLDKVKLRTEPSDSLSRGYIDVAVA